VPPQIGTEESPITLASETPKLLATAPAVQPPSANDRPVRAKPTPSSGVRMHTVQRGDTLFNLAQRYYGSSSKWRDIFEANRDLLPSQNSLRIGMELKIP
jgi:nucleoid-associated protein YgaU